MNGLVIVLIGIVALGAGYLLYGRWLAKKWGLDPKAKTPAYTKEDGQDYVPGRRNHRYCKSIRRFCCRFHFHVVYRCCYRLWYHSEKRWQNE